MSNWEILDRAFATVLRVLSFEFFQEPFQFPFPKGLFFAGHLASFLGDLERMDPHDPHPTAHGHGSVSVRASPGPRELTTPGDGWTMPCSLGRPERAGSGALEKTP